MMMRIFRVTLDICEPCLDGVGEECHTPDCALWLHSVDLPIHREFLERCELVNEYDIEERGL